MRRPLFDQPIAKGVFGGTCTSWGVRRVPFVPFRVKRAIGNASLLIQHMFSQPLASCLLLLYTRDNETVVYREDGTKRMQIRELRSS